MFKEDMDMQKEALKRRKLGRGFELSIEIEPKEESADEEQKEIGLAPLGAEKKLEKGEHEDESQDLSLIEQLLSDASMPSGGLSRKGLRDAIEKKKKLAMGDDSQESVEE